MTSLPSDDGTGKAGDPPEQLIVHGPTWVRSFPFDDISQELLKQLVKGNWAVMRSRAGIHAISPFLREA